jgi:predicted  nucleic acid-binding Zn-ribbon protein
MKQQLVLLYQLQQTDSQIEADETELSGLDDGETLAEELEAEEAQLSELEDKLSATQAELHDKQLQLQGTEDDRQDKWDQTYGGRISDPKELSALERKIEELDRRTGKLEEDIILLLDEVETLQEQVNQKQADVEEMSNQLSVIRRHCEQRSAELDTELEQLSEQRTELETQTKSSLLDDYEHTRQNSANVAVTVAKNRACSACHTAVASSLLGELQQPTRVVRCESCRRILVLDKWI